MSKESSINIGSLFLVAFVILKLCHVIEWSWWWVLSPAWIPFGILIAYIILGVIFLALKHKYQLQQRKKFPERYKSKWQLRIEEMQKRNNYHVNKNN